jgi:hypothetical protein
VHSTPGTQKTPVSFRYCAEQFANDGDLICPFEGRKNGHGREFRR